jgi:hypothetical protein
MNEADGIPFEFACYIASRMSRDTPWTHVYDEMCRVVQSRAFRGMGYAELSDAGVSLAITGLDRLSRLLDKAWEGEGERAGRGAATRVSR